MKSQRVAAAFALGCMALVVVAMPSSAATDHGSQNHTAQYHPDHGDGGHALELDNGNKWATDSPLRAGMARLRGLMAEAIPAIHRGGISHAEYDLLADAVSAEITFLVNNCQLEPAADVQLHKIIATILSGVGIMQGRVKDQQRQRGAGKIVAAVNDYGRYFDDPGFVLLNH